MYCSAALDTFYPNLSKGCSSTTLYAQNQHYSPSAYFTFALKKN